MSNIPSTAIHAAFTPIQRASNELIRARKVQAEKASHRTEDVEELDDTAVSSVDERKQGQGRQKDRGKRKEGEKVEIAALTEAGLTAGTKLSGRVPQLDISA